MPSANDSNTLINSIALGKVLESGLLSATSFCSPLELQLQQVKNPNQHFFVYNYYVNLNSSCLVLG